MGTVETGTLSQLLLAIPLQISAGCRCCWSQSRMKILLLAAALVSQVVGRPQQGEYQPGNGWGNTRPAQPTQWSAWSSGGGAAPTSYNSYDSYNSYNPYNPYNSYVPGGNKQPYLRSNSYDSYMPGGNKQPYLRSGDSVSGSVGGPAIQDIGLNNQGSLPDVETTRGDMGEPQMAGNVDEYQGWNTFQQGPLLTQSLHSREDSHSHHPLAVEEPVHHHVAQVAAQALGEEPAPQPAQVLAHSHSLDLAQCLSPCHSLCQHPCHSPCLCPCHSLLLCPCLFLCPRLCMLGTVALGVVANCLSQADVNWVLDLRWVLFLAQLQQQAAEPQTEICPLMGSVKRMDAREQLDDQTLASAAR